MKNIFLVVLREIGIALLMLVVLAAITVLAFKDQLPFNKKIPSGDQYAQVNKRTYAVSSTDRISEVNAITVTHEANQQQIVDAENDVRIQTGKYTPFGSINGTSDLPSERVGISVMESGSGENKNTDENDDELYYPESTGDLIGEFEKDQSQDSASVAEKRFDNVD